MSMISGQLYFASQKARRCNNSGSLNPNGKTATASFPQSAAEKFPSAHLRTGFKARDSQGESLDADTRKGSLSTKVTPYVVIIH